VDEYPFAQDTHCFHKFQRPAQEFGCEIHVREEVAPVYGVSVKRNGDEYVLLHLPTYVVKAFVIMGATKRAPWMNKPLSIVAN
jgi:hypothetical protein